MKGEASVEFNALPPGLRERLARRLSGRAAPAPILREPVGSLGYVSWSLLAAAALGVASLTLGCGWGASFTGVVRSGAVAAALYGAAAFSFSLALLSILRD